MATATDAVPADLNDQVLQRRAIDAAIWGMPIVSVNAMRQAYFRDAKASYNDIVFWSKPADWKNQTTTPVPSVRYVYFNFNTTWAMPSRWSRMCGSIRWRRLTIPPSNAS